MLLAPPYTITKEMLASSDPDFCIMHCGPREPWNLLSAMCVAGGQCQAIRPRKKFHFTVVDESAAALARLLILFEFMFLIHTSRSPVTRDRAISMAYVFGCQLIPPWVSDILTQAIDRLTTALGSDRPIFDNTFVSIADRGSILQHLFAWKDRLQRPRGKFTASNMRANTIEQNRLAYRRPSRLLAEAERLEASGEKGGAISVMRDLQKNEESKESLLWCLFGVAFPPDDVARSREPRLYDLKQEFFGRMTEGSVRVRIAEYLDAKWKPNVILFDIGEEESAQIVDEPPNLR
jgi:hypothetical protein